MSGTMPDTGSRTQGQGGPVTRPKTKPPTKTNKLINRAVVRVNVYLYRKSGGKILGRFGEIDALLLTTLGRKTGRTRTNPAAYVYDAGRFVLCAAYGGEAVNPAWLLNLRAIPKASVEIGREKINVTAEVLPPGAERDRLWQRMIDVMPRYAKFQNKSDRLFPIVILTPTA